MFDPPPLIAPSPRQVLATYRATHHKLVADGEIKPLVFPYHFSGLHLLLLYLLVSHKNRPWLYKARWLVFIAVVAFEVSTVGERRCLGTAFSYATGLMASWSIVWSATMLIWRRPQWDCRRIERRELPENKETGSHGKESRSEKSSAASSPPSGNSLHLQQDSGYSSPESADELEEVDALLKDHGASRFEARKDKVRKRKTKRKSLHDSRSLDARDNLEPRFYWQSYPDSFGDRFSWCIDLLLNFRGPGWNWAAPSLPPLPAYITCSISNPSEVPDTNRLHGGDRSSKTKSEDELQMASRPSFRKHNILKFCLLYLMLDLCKTTMMHDSHFYLGPNSSPPPIYLPTIIANSRFLLRLYRTILSMTAVIFSLNAVFLLPTLLLTIPSIIGLRGHDFMYPPFFGPFVPKVCDEGLSGLWGGWWHQTFRYAFISPTSYFINNNWLHKRNSATKMVSLLIAFGISGFLHAAGSITVVGTSSPWKPMLFFLSQAAGIFIQTSFSAVFQAQIKAIPRSLRRTGNFSFAFCWLFLTSPLFLHDVASGGVWLYEPIPVSLLRGLGFGTEGDGWWCWGNQHGGGGGIGVGWYSGRCGRWWESGIGLF